MTNPSHLKVKRLIELDALPSVEEAWLYAVRDNKDYKVGVSPLVDDIADAVFEDVRELLPFITPEMFGAIGDGVADDSAAITAAIEAAAGIPVVFDANATYLVEEGVDVSDTSVIIVGSGATVVQNGDVYAFKIVVPYGAQVDITAITTDSIDLSGGTAGVSQVSKITAPGHTLVAGDMVKVIGDNLISGPVTTDNERVGEFARVSLVNGDDLWLYSVLLETYSSNPRIARMDTDKRVDIRDLRVESAPDSSITDNEAHFYIEGAYCPVVQNLTSWGGMSEALQFIGCFGAYTNNVAAVDLRTDSANQSFGYGVIEYSCEYGRHVNLLGHNIRHAYTTGCLATTADDSRTARYGRTKYSTIVGGVGINCQTAAFDTHADAYRITFQNCVANYPFTGPSGTPRGFQIRGIGCRIIDCEANGGYGFVAYADADSPDNSRDHHFINCRYTGHPMVDTAGLFPFRIQGRAAGAISGVVVTNCTFEQPNGTAAAVRVEYGGVYLDNPTFICKKSGAANVLSLANSASVKGKAGRVDFTGSVGNQSFSALDGTSSIVWGEQALEIVSGGAAVTGLANFNSADGTAIFPMADFTDGAPSNANGFTNVGTGAIARNHFVVNGGRSPSARTRMAFTYNATGNQSISLVYRTVPVIQAECTVTATGVVITNIASGLVDGQEIVIRNLRASTQSLTVRSNNGNLEFDADANIAPGQALRLAFNMADTKWRKAN